MFIWYRNSILASIVSLIGCAGVVAGISELFKDASQREMSVPETIGFIAAGLLFAVLGKVISSNKEKKKQASASQSAPIDAAYAQPAAARAVQQTPAAEPYVPVAGNEKPMGKSIGFAKVCYLLAMALCLAGFYSYRQLIKKFGGLNSGFTRLSVLLLLTGICCLLLMIACSKTKRNQAVSGLFVPGFLGLIAIQAEDAFRCYRAWGFGGYTADDGTTYHSLISAPLLRIAALLLLLLFAAIAMKNAYERKGGMVRGLWLLPSVLLALAFTKAFTDSYLYDLVVNTLFRKGVVLTMRPEYLDFLSQIMIVLGALFTGFFFRGVCKQAPVAEQQPVFVQAQAETTAYAAPVYEAPQQPIYEAEPVYETAAPAAAPVSPQEVEKKLRAYKDLLDCGILTQEEYNEKVAELTH